ncbi:MAG: CBS domain-containing protein [Hyphomicrobiales bacterium]|nr:CBS domain-containing protein [Hyphomicrobiales bacterium]
MLTMLSEILEEKSGHVHTAAPSDLVSKAVRLMRQADIGALPVLYNGRLVGILSERDILARIVDERLDPASTAVFQVMTSNPECASPTMTVEAAMRMMSRRRFRHLPVMSDGRLIGIISIRDLSEWIIRNQQTSIEKLVRTVHSMRPPG